MLEPVEIIVVSYLVVLSALIAFAHVRIEPWAQLMAVHALGVAVIMAVANVETRARARGWTVPIMAFGFVRSWYIVPAVPVIYSELRNIIPLIHPRDFDMELAAIDQWIFGVHPTVWLERWLWPPLTEVLQIFYATYYPLPILLGLVLWWAGRFGAFRFWVFTVVFGFLVSYLGYILVPAIGPRFLPLITQAQTQALSGVWLYEPIRSFLDRAEGMTRDCFPSGHTEIMLLVLYYAHRFDRRTFKAMLPFGIAIILSTTYLRYHYVIDVAAGVAVAAAVIGIAQPLYSWLGGDVNDFSGMMG